jgi:hypothetical protein
MFPSSFLDDKLAGKGVFEKKREASFYMNPEQVHVFSHFRRQLEEVSCGSFDVP